MPLLSVPRSRLGRGLAALLACSAPVGAYAQTSGSDADPTQLANVPPEDRSRERQIMVGAFVAYSPAYLGADEYQLMAGPSIQLRYDRAFLSLQDGLGYDLVRSGGWRAGPTISLRQPRRQSGNSPLMIAGERTDDLQGLGTIKASADVGGFIAYERRAFSAKLDVRQATNTDLGLIATLSARYTAMIPMSSRPGPPAIFSIGPRISFVDDKYNQSYFGITTEQSVRSGLREYRAKGGVLSAGVGASAIVPLGSRVSAMVLAGYDRLTDDAARSPLVEDRGSRDQATVGLGLVYRFGL
jgi:outer membrane scaffolding protein for murein synthesis (MipA/OmpV family)